jgi:hypothetical protein
MLSRNRPGSRSANAESFSSTRTRISPSVLVGDAKSTRNTTSTYEAGATVLDLPLLPWPRGPRSASMIAALQRQQEPLVSLPLSLEFMH